MPGAQPLCKFAVFKTPLPFRTGDCLRKCAYFTKHEPSQANWFSIPPSLPLLQISILERRGCCCLLSCSTAAASEMNHPSIELEYLMENVYLQHYYYSSSSSIFLHIKKFGRAKKFLFGKCQKVRVK